MEPIVLILYLLIAMPWVISASWLAFTSRKNLTLLMVSVTPWLLACLALLWFHLTAQANLAADGPDANDTGVNFGYVAFISVGFFSALTANILSAAIFLLYWRFFRSFQHSEKPTQLPQNPTSPPHP